MGYLVLFCLDFLSFVSYLSICLSVYLSVGNLRPSGVGIGSRDSIDFSLSLIPNSLLSFPYQCDPPPRLLVLFSSALLLFQLSYFPLVLFSFLVSVSISNSNFSRFKFSISLRGKADRSLSTRPLA